MSLLSGRVARPSFALAAALTGFVAALHAQAATATPELATAGSFAVLAASTVTNTGPSTILGDLGVSPGTAITGFGPGIVSAGTIHSADAVALQAQRDLTSAYNAAAGLPPSGNVTADLAGQRLSPGVYAGTTLSLSGALTLDAGGDGDAVFVFQSASTLITASTSSVLLLGGADPCNVFWQVGSSATLGTNSTFVGSVMALTSVTANTGAAVQGRLLARNGAVTLDTNTVSRPLCVAAATPAPTPSTATTTPAPSASASPAPVTAVPVEAATPAPTPSTATTTTAPSASVSPAPVTVVPVEVAPIASPAALAPVAAPPSVLPAPEVTAAPAPTIAEPMPPAPLTPTSAPATPPSSIPVASAVPPSPSDSTPPGSSTRVPNPGADSSTSLTVPETAPNPEAAPPADLTQQVTAGEPPTTIVELPSTGAPITALAGVAALLLTFGLLCLIVDRTAGARASRLQGISMRGVA